MISLFFNQLLPEPSVTLSRNVKYIDSQDGAGGRPAER